MTLPRRRRAPRWLRELADECVLAATHAEQGGGMDAVAALELRVRACAKEHGWELGDVVRELARIAPRAPAGRHNMLGEGQLIPAQHVGAEYDGERDATPRSATA